MVPAWPHWPPSASVLSLVPGPQGSRARAQLWGASREACPKSQCGLHRAGPATQRRAQPAHPTHLQAPVTCPPKGVRNGASRAGHDDWARKTQSWPRRSPSHRRPGAAGSPARCSEGPRSASLSRGHSGAGEASASAVHFPRGGGGSELPRREDLGFLGVDCPLTKRENGI